MMRTIGRLLWKCGVIGGAIVAAFVVRGCWICTYGINEKNLSLDKLQQRFEITFPASATDIRSFAHHQGISGNTCVRFEMAPRELPSLISQGYDQSSAITEEYIKKLREDNTSDNTADDINTLVSSEEYSRFPLFSTKWWRPWDAIHFEIRHKPTRQFCINRIFVDKTNKQRYIVYLFYYYTH